MFSHALDLSLVRVVLRALLRTDELDPSEIPPLIDALSKNGSLTFLNLAKSGIAFSGPEPTGRPLVDKMAHSASALSSLESIIIREGGYAMPVSRLRDPAEALAAIRQARLFAPGGPRREEVLFMGDLLRQEGEDGPADAAVKLLTAARANKVKRDMWEEMVTQLMVDGALRRGHLQALISAEALRDVKFSATELLAAGFELPTLREGGFTAAEMRKAGLKAAELGAAGWTPAQLKGGGYTARNLREAGYSAAAIKSGGFSVRQLKGVGFSAAELKANGCTCTGIHSWGSNPLD